MINMGALLKVIWSFYYAGSSAWSIIPAVAIGAVVINVVMGVVYWRIRRRTEASAGARPDGKVTEPMAESALQEEPDE